MLVSVIIPAYNAALFIADTINSVIQQTYTNWELIIVNDGSTDNTAIVVKKFSDTDKRIKIINQINRGCSGAKNIGLVHVKGDYIQYLDADDVLSIDKLNYQIEALKNSPLSLAICKTVIFQSIEILNTNKEIDTGFLYSTTNSFEFLLNLYGINGQIGMIQPNAFLVPRKIIDKIGLWNESISPAPDEDGEYFCRAILAAESIVFTQGVNYYRKIEKIDSLSKKRSYVYALGALKSVELKAKHLLAYENSERIKHLMATHFASVVYQYAHEYLELINKAEDTCLSIGIKKIPVSGGKNFVLLAKSIGFRNAIILKKVLKKKLHINPLRFE